MLNRTTKNTFRMGNHYQTIYEPVRICVLPPGWKRNIDKIWYTFSSIKYTNLQYIFIWFRFQGYILPFYHQMTFPFDICVFQRMWDIVRVFHPSYRRRPRRCKNLRATIRSCSIKRILCLVSMHASGTCAKNMYHRQIFFEKIIWDFRLRQHWKLSISGV